MDAIFNRHYRMVMSVALHIVRDPGEAQDVVQIVFTELYQKAKLFNPAKGNLKTWLLQYAYGRSINRKQSLRLRNFYDHAELEAVDPARYAVETRVFDMETPEATRFVEEILASLNDRQRLVIDMVCFRGMTMAEIAASTGESVGNIQHTYYRAIEKLRSYVTATVKHVKAQPTPLFGRLRAIVEKANVKKGEVEIVKARAL